MVELGDIPEAILWHEGMLLAPQHFQQASMRAEALVGYAMGSAALYPWGVRRLSLDRPLLAGGRVRVVELEAILPDGLPLLYPREGEPLLELDLAPYKDELAQSEMAVHVVVPVDSPRPAPGELRRYRSVEGRPVADANTGEGEIGAPRLRPALSLALTASPTVPPQRRYVSMPIARVSFKDDAFALEAFAPPRMDIPAGTPLADVARGVAQRLREKASALSERLQAPSAEGGDMPGGNLMDALRAMVEPLPRLEGLVQAETVHPFLVYLALCDLMGNLSWLGGQPVPPPPPRYVHEDALPAFQSMAEFLLRMIDRVRETYRALRFQRVADDQFSLELAPALLTSASLVVGARVAPGATPADTAEWLANALIGSRPVMRAIGERRIRGARRQRIDQAAELGLTPPATMVLARVAAEPEFIQAGQPLEIVGGAGGGAAPSEIQLFTAQPAAARPTAAAAAPAAAKKPPPGRR